MRLALISDTHLPQLMHSLDELGPEVRAALNGVDLILHGGDVCIPKVLDWLEESAPVLACRGNHDLFEDARLDEVQLLELEGWRIGMAHELRPESRPIPQILDSALAGAPVDILIGGDTHVERLEYRDEVVLINPGSPNLPHHLTERLGTIGYLDLEPGYVRAELHVLGYSDGARNPGRAQHVVIQEEVVVEASLDGEALAVEEFLKPPGERGT